jgi:hypothetical protein
VNKIRSLQKGSTLPPRRTFLQSGGGGEKNLFLIIVSVLNHPSKELMLLISIHRAHFRRVQRQVLLLPVLDKIYWW